jgi:N-acetylneuraminate lyase
MDLAEAWATQKAPDFMVIIHAGRASAREGATLARHAEKVGADAVGAIYLHHEIPAAVDEVVTFCAEIAAGAPELPFYYYHMPAQTRLPFKASQILQAAARAIPNLAGCKFTWEDLMDFQQCQQMEDGRLDIVFGRDEMLLASLAIGAEGWIGSTFNYAGLLHRKIIAAFRSHDFSEARRLQLQVNEVIRIMVEQGGLPAGKAISRLHGLDLGSVRPPLKPMSDNAMQQLAKRLAPYRLGPAREVAAAA